MLSYMFELVESLFLLKFKNVQCDFFHILNFSCLMLSACGYVNIFSSL